MDLILDLDKDDRGALKNLLIQKRDEETGDNKILLGKLVISITDAENRLKLQDRILEKVKKILSDNTRREPFASDWKKIELKTTVHKLGIGKTRLKDIIRPAFNRVLEEEGSTKRITMAEAEKIRDVKGGIGLILNKIDES